jgi:ABC-2 type transport system permease protein
LNWNKYLEISFVSFRESFAYRLDAIMSLFSTSLSLLMYYFVWKAITMQGAVNSSLNEIMTYYIVAKAVQSSVFVTVEKFIGPKIQHGTVVNELKRPLSLLSHCYFRQIGKSGFDALTGSLPILIIGFILVDITLTPISIILFILSVFLSFNLIFLFSYVASMLIFWTKIEWAIRGSRHHIQKLLSGAVFPLFLIPEPLQSVFYMLPFQAMIDAPVRILSGGINLQNTALIFLNQLFWIIVLLIVARFAWSKAKKKLTVQGG